MLRRALTAVLLAPIRFYRRYLSGLKRAPTCRFLPTCSEYALEAIQRRGPIVGLGKAAWRIVRRELARAVVRSQAAVGGGCMGLFPEAVNARVAAGASARG